MKKVNCKACGRELNVADDHDAPETFCAKCAWSIDAATGEPGAEQ